MPRETSIDRIPEATSRESDEELLLAYRETGDMCMFEELVHRYGRELYSYLRRYLGNAEMAEDAFQQTWLQIHLKCNTFEDGRKVRPWLYTIATHQAIDALRRHKRHKMPSLDRRGTASGEGADEGALVDLLRDDSSEDPAVTLALADIREHVREAVGALADPFRQVVELVYFERVKYREAADILQIPVGTVKSRLHAAVEKIKELLPEEAAA
ncbi:MAG: RNA polymerase sigma factor [Candidatus Peribacteraceae bacterium]|nr:RNA polymerase sigma factor [Candidatus Peribacteraceae bacterium]